MRFGLTRAPAKFSSPLTSHFRGMLTLIYTAPLASAISNYMKRDIIESLFALHPIQNAQLCSCAVVEREGHFDFASHKLSVRGAMVVNDAS